MSFKLESFYNPHLSPGSTRIDAVLTVTSAAAEQAASATVGFFYLVDVSGSMSDNDKLVRTKIALRRSLDLLPPTAKFGIIAFNGDARLVVPLTFATPAAIAGAHKSVQGLAASGNTAMSTALTMAREQFSAQPDLIALAQLLTDGENSDADAKPLADALVHCKGVFQCDCRGIGTDWRPTQLRQIASALLGSADAVGEGDALEADFKATLERALNKGVANAVLRLWAPKTARIVSVKQMLPEIVDLTAMGQRFDDKTLDYPLGAWGTESRDYHVGIELPAGVEGDEVLACRPSLVFEEAGVPQKVAGSNVVAAWTADDALTTRINAQVAHYTGQSELAESIRDGLEAKSHGDVDRATKLLGKAVKIAAASGNEEVTRRLRKVVDVVDEAQGTVRIRKGENKAAELELDMGGTRTVRRRAPTKTE